MLAELDEYIHSDPIPADASTVEATKEYLTACYHLYEREILNKISLHKSDGYIIKQMDKGHNYLVSWLDSLLANKGTCIYYVYVLLYKINFRF